MRHPAPFVIPAKAGIHCSATVSPEAWTPAFAGVTVRWCAGSPSSGRMAMLHLDFWIGVGVMAGIYGIFALGLQINVGFTGLLNLGQAGFMAIGAYAMGMLVVDAGWSIWAAMPAAILVAVAAGLLVGLPSLRLRSDYFAIATIAFAEIVRYTFQNAEFAGGNQGILGFDEEWRALAGWRATGWPPSGSAARASCRC